MDKIREKYVTLKVRLTKKEKLFMHFSELSLKNLFFFVFFFFALSVKAKLFVISVSVTKVLRLICTSKRNE